MRRLPIVLLAAVLVVAASAGAAWKVSGSRTIQFFGEHVDRVATTEKVIALTFDDGPDEATDEILALLAERDVAATFYLNGAGMADHPESGPKIVAAGHELGNHTWSHRRMLLVSPSAVADQIEPTDERIRAAGWDGPITFRPPYGKKLFVLPWYLARHDRLTVMWDVSVETFGDTPQSAAEIADATVAAAEPGSIVLLHPWNDRRHVREATGVVIDRLRADGYRFVTVSDLLSGT
ncbi:polysaccharide deacetylase family protein [Millisia brevis]|uniref:polysaccharide deacetylase family protein n=1 Tax=Millisia brevis TaxID=264148 RepID=UPI000A6F5DA3|nr:polysaccharide deacetylase family protein [Millisia brevis]